MNEQPGPYSNTSFATSPIKEDIEQIKARMSQLIFDLGLHEYNYMVKKAQLTQEFQLLQSKATSAGAQ